MSYGPDSTLWMRLAPKKDADSPPSAKWSDLLEMFNDLFQDSSQEDTDENLDFRALENGFANMLFELYHTNRHAVATRANVGTPKALCLKNHCSSIYPKCRTDAKVLLSDDLSEKKNSRDFVLDCIDNIDANVSFPP
ncbi:hypothetical protein L1987_24092 [Smallanthus sonchifolius]|uniref:Uncharacterized protein n=1 Tax=Smallanthus sonchifolius TaxID=185202 RepID=A0ACB9IJ96_9ASTR|nr:hypothetical protein L1987_24092 [Smallanthus sonchifolius]